MRTTGVTKEVRMPAKLLPSNPSLDHLKYQARDLLNAFSQGDVEALARAREFHPRFARMSNDEIRAAKFPLADAQLVIAREYGFQSWSKLKHHVELSTRASASGAASISSFEFPVGPVELKQKWASGTRIVRETDLKQKMEIYTPGQANPVKQELSLKSQYAFSTARELPTGGREVELQYLGFRLEVDVGRSLWRYDSAQGSAAGPSQIADMFKTIMGARIRYFLSAENQVERIEGVDEMLKRLNVFEGAKLKPGMTWDNKALDKVLKRIISGTRQPDESTAWGLRKMFNEEHFKSKLDSSFFPGKAVKPGDTWTVSRESRKNKRSLFSANVMREFTVTFRAWEMHADRLCARLDFHGTQKTSAEAESEAARAINPITEGTFSGVTWFDPESGRGIETTVKHDFQVTSNKLAMPVLSARPPVQAVTDHHHQDITDKLISVDGPV
jgi:hypothetical protein